MPPDLIKALQDALQAQFQAGYAAAKLDVLIGQLNLQEPDTGKPTPP